MIYQCIDCGKNNILPSYHGCLNCPVDCISCNEVANDGRNINKMLVI